MRFRILCELAAVALGDMLPAAGLAHSAQLRVTVENLASAGVDSTNFTDTPPALPG